MQTNSLNWPNMFDVSRNRCAVAEDSASIVNRVKLMILTEPTELYMNPTYGVGLKRHLFKYNTENERAIIRDRIVQQLKLWEPEVDADKTEFADGLLYTGDQNSIKQDYNQLNMTITLRTIYGDTLTVNLSE